MPAGLADIAPRLDPLIRRLATGHDGERLATVAALERALVAAGASWHDLADALAPSERHDPANAESFRLAAQLVDNPALSAWERGFVRNLHRRLRRGRPISERQRQVLVDVHERVVEAAA